MEISLAGLMLIIITAFAIGYFWGAWIESGTPPDNHTNTREDL